MVARFNLKGFKSMTDRKDFAVPATLVVAFILSGASTAGSFIYFKGMYDKSEQANENRDAINVAAVNQRIDDFTNQFNERQKDTNRRVQLVESDAKDAFRAAGESYNIATRNRERLDKQ